jgi:hypothetical protein
MFINRTVSVCFGFAAAALRVNSPATYPNVTLAAALLSSADRLRRQFTTGNFFPVE